ncbi:MAG: DUF3347 domain-containing protein, partial [Planctomycetaceae bacterium]|nr:DUF3347 domain-containing protein [Planctomycetaceae bacterium]
VYVQLPDMPTFAEPAFQTLSTVIQGRETESVREAFVTYGNMLDRPYDQPGTSFARNQWNGFADRLAQLAVQGQRAASAKDAESIFGQLEAVMVEVREQFAPSDRPTFEGREIVLGPRAGSHYLVRHGLTEGELVVTQGNFKIDAEIQIQAKPSMMTPEGGGGGGHHHGGDSGAAKKPTDEHAGHQTALPQDFRQHLQALENAYEQVTAAFQRQDVVATTASFKEFGNVLASADGSQLTGHQRMLWKEFLMLLSNDAVEGAQVEELADAERVYLLLKGHMRRMREQLGVMQHESSQIERLAVGPEFQEALKNVWQQYLVVGNALATDNLADAENGAAVLETLATEVDGSLLEPPASDVWKREQASLLKLIASLQEADDIAAARNSFLPISQEIGVLAQSFGFGSEAPVWELHCPMAFRGKGATWYQDNDQVRNPYFGATMLKCADRVSRVVSKPLPESAAGAHQHNGHEDHSQH